jgi:hypothetical protein
VPLLRRSSTIREGVGQRTSTVQTDYEEIVDVSTDYQSQASSTYSSPMESYSSTSSCHTQEITHDEWHSTPSRMIGSGEVNLL